LLARTLELRCRLARGRLGDVDLLEDQIPSRLGIDTLLHKFERAVRLLKNVRALRLSLDQTFLRRGDGGGVRTDGLSNIGQSCVGLLERDLVRLRINPKK